MTTQNTDFFESGNDLPEQQVDQTRFRKVQFFNESAYHRKTSVHLGGYGIANETDDAPPIGKTEVIEHRGGNKTTMAVAREIEVAIIGFSPTYRVVEGTDKDGKWRSAIVPEWSNNLPEGWRIRTAISLFLVLKADPKQELYELTFKGYTTGDAKTMLGSLIKACNMMGSAYTKEKGRLIRVHPFAWWLTLGVAESRMVGKSEQSPVTPPCIKNVMDRATLEGRMVTKEEYLAFIDLRKQVDEFIKTGRYAGQYDDAGNVALPAGVGQPVAALASGNGKNEPPF